MKNNRLYIVLLMVSLATGSCKTVAFRKYFPAEDNRPYIYRYTNDTVPKRVYEDTLICRARDALSLDQVEKKNHITLFGPNSEFAGGSKAVRFFYFDKLNTNIDSPYYKDKSFLRLSACYFKGHLFLSDVYSVNQSNWNELFSRVIPQHAKINRAYTYREGDFLRIFNIEGYEDVLINNVVHSNCLKLSVQEKWLRIYPTDTVWLKKGVGVVKWKNADGYTGILKF